jgi:hypothetical protein
MTFRVLALASGVTGLEDHRLALNTLLFPNGGGLKTYGGVVPGGFGLTNPSPMIARIASGFAAVPGTVSATEGAYLLVSDSNVDITFDNGEAGVARTDRIIARVYDNTYDATGQTKGIVEYLKGQASGAATALPPNSILLYEQSVAAGASAGGTPINFSSVTDQRRLLSAVGGIQSVASATERDALTPSWNGKMVWRRDRGWLEVQDSSNVWRVRSPATVASTSNFNQISNPHAGLTVTLSSDGSSYTYDGSGWNRTKENGQMTFKAVRNSTQSIGNAVQTTVICGTTIWNKGMTYNTSTGIWTCVEDGLYTVTGRVEFDTDASGYRELYTNISGDITKQIGIPSTGSAFALPMLTFSETFQIDAGETVKIMAKQGSGSSLNVTGASFWR